MTIVTVSSYFLLVIIVIWCIGVVATMKLVKEKMGDLEIGIGVLLRRLYPLLVFFFYLDFLIWMCG